MNHVHHLTSSFHQVYNFTQRTKLKSAKYFIYHTIVMYYIHIFSTSFKSQIKFTKLYKGQKEKFIKYPYFITSSCHYIVHTYHKEYSCTNFITKFIYHHHVHTYIKHLIKFLLKNLTLPSRLILSHESPTSHTFFYLTFPS